MTRRFPYPSVSRRRFLQGAVPAALSLRGLPALAAKSLAPPAFEQILPARSGITWVHTAGKSAEKHLPETSGAGCAFLDYDNDGWMDIYLVNSGACDFYTPETPLRNALYRNNRDGTFTDVTEKAGVAGGGYGMGVAVGDYNGDGLPDMLCDRLSRYFLYRNNGDGTFTDVTKKAGVVLTAGHKRGLVRLRQRRAARSLRLPVRQIRPRDEQILRRCGEQTAPLLHSDASIQPSRSWLFHNNGDGTFTDVTEASGHCRLARQGMGRGGRGHQQRRLDGPVCRERHGGEFPVRESTARQVYRARLVAGVAYSATGRRARAWAWTRRITTRTAGWTCSSRTSTSRCIRSIATTTTGRLTMWRRAPASAVDSRDERLGHAFLRL